MASIEILKGRQVAGWGFIRELRVIVVAASFTKRAL